MKIEVRIARDFSKFPGGRYRKTGDFSGQEFREDVLHKHLRKGDTLKVILDGVDGYPPSFLEEAFGGLVREGFPVHDILDKIEIAFESEEYLVYKEMVSEYLADAADELEKS